MAQETMDYEIFVTVEGGLLSVRINRAYDGISQTSTHSYNPRNQSDRMAFGALLKARGIREVMCSSSVDFPEDGGCAGMDVRGIIEHSLNW